MRKSTAETSNTGKNINKIIRKTRKKMMRRKKKEMRDRMKVMKRREILITSKR
jgi:hypothetical protein